jgi:hypothetical protein
MVVAKLARSRSVFSMVVLRVASEFANRYLATCYCPASAMQSPGAGWALSCARKMQLPTYTDYALRALIYVGSHAGEPVSAPAIAHAYGIRSITSPAGPGAPARPRAAPAAA